MAFSFLKHIMTQPTFLYLYLSNMCLICVQHLWKLFTISLLILVLLYSGETNTPSNLSTWRKYSKQFSAPAVNLNNLYKTNVLRGDKHTVKLVHVGEIQHAVVCSCCQPKQFIYKRNR